RGERCSQVLRLQQDAGGCAGRSFPRCAATGCARGRCGGGSSDRSRHPGRSDAAAAGRDGTRRGGDDARRAPRPLGVALEPQTPEGQKATVKRLGAAAVLAVVGLVLCPGVADAWTPGTAIFLADSVLANLPQLPP